MNTLRNVYVRKHIRSDKKLYERLEYDLNIRQVIDIRFDLSMVSLWK